MIKISNNVGHRGRLRRRFFEAGLEGFLDYEIIELLLTLGTPRKDCKQTAKEAIKKFGGLKGVLDTLPEDLQQIKGIGPRNIFGLKLFQAVSEQYQKSGILRKNKLDSSEIVVNYLREKLGRKKKEYFVLLSLDSVNNLVKISDISIGTLNTNLVHPREVFQEAILAHAAKVIIAHNHPSGNLNPSTEDLVITKSLVKTGKVVGIKILDHLIITSDGYLSFKEKGLLNYAG